MSVGAYILLLVAVGGIRLLEVRISRHNQRRLTARGIAKIPDPNFRWMVLFHAGILVAAGLEVVLLNRPLHPVLALLMGLLLVLSTSMRWWVIHVMSEHWNIQVMASVPLGVVADGPFRWVRHPNYAAVFVELIALPLIHSAWFTALIGGAIHAAILRQRIRVEESVLLSNLAYKAVMGAKPRFLPRFSRASASATSEGLKPQT